MQENNSESPSEAPQDLPIQPPPSSPKWKAQLHRLNEKLKAKSRELLKKAQQNLNKESIKKKAQNFDPQAFSDWASKTFQKRGAAFYGTLATIVLSTYFMADLLALVAGEYIPDPPVSRSFQTRGNLNRTKSFQDYGVIFSRNLFNSQGLIPGDEPNSGSPSDLGGPPVRTTLPLNLVGTLIMSNELRSIATIEDKSSSMVYPVRIEDEIPDKIRILKIEPRKVIFVNKSSGRREFIELPEEALGTHPRIVAGGAMGSGGAGGGIEKVAPTQFNVSRSEVDKALADFNNILTQARAVPNFENGVASGYKLFQIVPGSIYDKLGLQNGDVISGLNGQPINDPGKAFEMLNELKTSSHLELQVKKDGKVSTYTYDIR